MGRKRHILVNTLGLMLVVVFHSATTHDWQGARERFNRMTGRLSRLRHNWADSAYAKDDLPAWVWDLREGLRIPLEIVKDPGHQNGFRVLPKRWIVERAFGWLMKQRRLVRDYEYLPETSETFIYLAINRLMLKRLERATL
jgi:putative transposase